MKIRFIKDITVETTGGIDNDAFFRKNQIIEAEEVLSISNSFYNILLQDGRWLIDVRKSDFEHERTS